MFFFTERHPRLTVGSFTAKASASQKNQTSEI